jgi:hypothetical protein
MRSLVLILAATGLLIGQSAEPSVLGRLTAVSPDSIEIQDSHGTHLLFSDQASTIWRGKERHDFSALQIGDEILVRYHIDPSSRAVVIALWANIDKVEGRITFVGRSGFQVDQNYSADPASGYRRRMREILYDSGTRWDESVVEDLKIGRNVFVIGLKLPNGVAFGNCIRPTSAV